MSLSAQELCCFSHSALKRGDRKPWPALVEQFNGIAIRKHIDHLRYRDTSAFNREFSACAVRTGFKVFVLHSMSIVARRLIKVKYFKGLGNSESMMIPK